MKITEKFLLSCGFLKEPSLPDSSLFRGHGIMIWKEGKRWVMRSIFFPKASRVLLYRATSVSELLENIKKLAIYSVCSSLEPLYLEQ